jgi:predicted secreted Zn-dependent protease
MRSRPKSHVLLPLIAALLWGGLAVPGQAASVARTYSYFTIRGNTLQQIEDELSKKGPEVDSTGTHHPGATTMEFRSKITFEESRTCRIRNADVVVKAHIKLPRWRDNRDASPETTLVWETLASDIKRHEESHVIIAKNYGRKIEKTLEALPPQQNCDLMRAKAKEATAKLLAQHDAAQQKFDKIEGINFEDRIMRLLKYRIERISK